MVEVNGRLKMMYMNGAYDAKAWRAINHFKATGEGPLLKACPGVRLLQIERGALLFHSSTHYTDALQTRSRPGLSYSFRLMSVGCVTLC